MVHDCIGCCVKHQLFSQEAPSPLGEADRFLVVSRHLPAGEGTEGGGVAERDSVEVLGSAPEREGVGARRSRKEKKEEKKRWRIVVLELSERGGGRR